MMIEKYGNLNELKTEMGSIMISITKIKLLGNHISKKDYIILS